MLPTCCQSVANLSKRWLSVAKVLPKRKIPVPFWQRFGNVLATLWQRFGNVLATFWQQRLTLWQHKLAYKYIVFSTFSKMLATFWQQVGTNVGNILATFWQQVFESLLPPWKPLTTKEKDIDGYNKLAYQ